MAVYNVHGGHNKHVTGAKKYLDEVTEDRKVKNYLIQYLNEAGHTVYDCTDENGKSQNANLANIVKKCNAHKVDLDVSIHLNSGGGTGVEVFNYDDRTKTVSDRICENISASLSIKNRGTKYSKELYVLRNTESFALLVECCFVDSKIDEEAWDAQKCAKAIAEGILGKAISEIDGNKADNKPSTPAKKPTSVPEVKGRGYAAGKWWGEVSSKTTSGTESYIGAKGQPLRALQLNTVGDASVAGKLKYRFRKLGGGWYNWQTDREMDKNGENFAGDKVSKFDRLQISLEGLTGYTAEYRAYDSKHGWLPWVRGFNNSNSNGYAGWDGYAIECVQVRVAKK